MPNDTDLPPLAAALPEAMLPTLRRLREDWHRRLRPVDAVECATADAIVAQSWRLGRLDALEERVLLALIEGRSEPSLPSLATVLRARNRLEKDRRAAEAELEALRAARPAELGSASVPQREAEPAAAEVESARPPRATAPEPLAAPLVATAWPREPDVAYEPEAHEDAHAGAEPDDRTVGTAASAPRLPPELEEVLAGMWRSAGGPGRAPEWRLAVGA